MDVQTEGITNEELQLAARNHGMPLEALRLDVSPPGLHYVLVHYDVPFLDAAAHRLSVHGLVKWPLSLSVDDLRARPTVDVTVTMECAGNGRALLEPRPRSQPWLVEAIGTARWTGVPVRDLLDEAGVEAGACEVVFGGADRGVEGGEEQRYQRSLTLEELLAGEAIVAYAMNGDPLPAQHGHPLRLVVPGWYGMTNVKWLTDLEVVAEPFQGYQNRAAYRMRQDAEDPGTPVRRIAPRSLLVPPGIPDFFTRRRVVPIGHTLLEGRAWSGMAEIVRVEVSVDGGETYADAALEPGAGPYAWRRFTLPWEPSVTGEHELCARATDAAGNVQPAAPPWNLGGYMNNAVQRVAVSVVADGGQMATPV
jgi:DMSO/TMAO reductase YedYZ molybdopterin-dependent catalytic subunit